MSNSDTPTPDAPQTTELRKCAYGDPYCPCQDGDACHYVALPGSPAMKIAHVKSDTTEQWRAKNHVTDFEFSEVSALLCCADPRDLALLVVRMRGRLDVAYQMRGVRQQS